MKNEVIILNRKLCKRCRDWFYRDNDISDTCSLCISEMGGNRVDKEAEKG